MRRKRQSYLCIAVMACLILAAASAISFADTHTHNGITFKELTEDDFEISNDEKFLKPGSYYLTQDWVFNKTVHISGSVNLCLNDHFIRSESSDGHGFHVYGVGALSLYDCGTTIRYWVPKTDAYYYTDRWFLQDSKPAGTEGSDYYVTHGGAITGISGGAISVGTLPPYDGSVSLTDVDVVGNGFFGLSFQGSGTCALNGSTTIQGNAGRNASRKINNNFRYYGDGGAAGTPLIVAEGFSGKIGVSRFENITGPISSTVVEGTETYFYADNDDYEVIRNKDKCLEIVPKTAKLIVKGPYKDGSSESTLATIEKADNKSFKVGDTIKLPTATLKGYTIGKLYDYSKSELFPDKYEAGNDFTVPHAETSLYANELALLIKEQPTSEQPTVVTEAEKVSYQWYEKKNVKPVEFEVSSRDNKYYASNKDELTGEVVHISFPDGVPDDLSFDTGSATKTGENTYDVVPGKIPMGRFLINVIQMSSSVEFRLTAELDQESEAAVDGQTEKTLKTSKEGTYFCRITGIDGVTADSDDVIIEKQEKPSEDPENKGSSTGDENALLIYVMLEILALGGIAVVVHNKLSKRG